MVNRGISGDTTGGMLVRLQRDVLGPALEERRCGGIDRIGAHAFAGAKDEWEWMKKADLLLCEAKRAGRARVWTDK